MMTARCVVWPCYGCVRRTAVACVVPVSPVQRLGLKWLSAMAGMVVFAGYYKRFRWSPLKLRKITY